jgi:uncharacterized membrane protein
MQEHTKFIGHWLFWLTFVFAIINVVYGWYSNTSMSIFVVIFNGILAVGMVFIAIRDGYRASVEFRANEIAKKNRAQ